MSEPRHPDVAEQHQVAGAHPDQVIGTLAARQRGVVARFTHADVAHRAAETAGRVRRLLDQAATATD